MSLESQVQALTAASNVQTAASQALSQEVAGKMAEIDKKADDVVARVDAAIPTAISTELCPSIYLHPDTGDDDLDGLSKANAVQTLTAAVNRVPEGGAGVITLAESGLVVTLNYNLLVRNKNIKLNLSGGTLEQATYGSSSIGGITPIGAYTNLIFTNGTISTALPDSIVPAASISTYLVRRTSENTLSVKLKDIIVQLGEHGLVSFGDYNGGFGALSLGIVDIFFRLGATNRSLASLQGTPIAISATRLTIDEGVKLPELIGGVTNDGNGSPINIVTNIADFF